MLHPTLGRCVSFSLHTDFYSLFPSCCGAMSRHGKTTSSLEWTLRGWIFSAEGAFSSMEGISDVGKRREGVNDQAGVVVCVVLINKARLGRVRVHAKHARP